MEVEKARTESDLWVAEVEPAGNGWKRFKQTRVVPEHRVGFGGLCDRLVSWWTGKPQRQINVTYTASVYAKDVDKMQIEIFNQQIERG